MRARFYFVLVMLSAPSLGAASLVGCFRSHGPEGIGPDGGAVRRDAGAVRDAGARVDAQVDLCGAPPPGVVVRVEPITSEIANCAGPHFDGIVVRSVEPAPADDGIRIHADFCPDADADCRCDVVVGNVGTDLAELVSIPAAPLSLDLEPTSLRLSQIPQCECLGCPCGLALVLDAFDGLLAPASTPELDLAQGAHVCPEPAPCVSARWALRASSLGIEGEAMQGETIELGAVHVRTLRNVDLFAPCAACAICGSPQASWVAWVRH